MTTKRRRFTKGIKLDPDTTSLTEEGEVKYDDTANKIQYRDDSADRSVVSEDGTQTLENKTIDGTSATGNNAVTADADDISYDNGVSGLTATDVKAAIDELDAAIEGQDEASEISFDNTTSGLAAVNVQDAIDEVDGNLDTHIADTTTHGTTGDIVGTSDTQALTNKTIDADSNTITNIEDADIKAAAAIDASKIADASVSNVEFQRLDGVTSDIQTQLDAKLDDFSSVNDDRLMRTDGVAGDAVQESPVSLTDAGAMSGITQLDVDNIQIDGNTISSTDTNGNVEFTPDGTGITKTNGPSQVTGTVTNDLSTDAAAGANVTLTAPTTKNIRLTGALTSLDGIPAGNSGQEVILINATGSIVTINDNTGGTAADRILTGTQAAINLSDEASIPLVYDGTEVRWMISAGVGGESGGGSLDIFYSEDFETNNAASLTSGNSAVFDASGSLAGTLADETSSEIAGTRSIKFTQAGGSLNDWFNTGSITLDEKQQNQGLKFTFAANYDGDAGDIDFIVWDSTNSVELASIPIESSSTKLYELVARTASSTATIKVGFQVKVLNSGKIMIFDDIEGSTVSTSEGFKFDSMSRVRNQSGHGATNTKISIFSTEIDSIGSDITYVSDGTDGDSWTVNSAGVYHISFTSASSSANAYSGISLNSTELTTNIQSITANDRLAMSRQESAAGTMEQTTAISVVLKAGDVVRAHTDGSAPNGTRQSFTISKVGSTSAIGLKQYYRAHTANGYGSTNTMIRRFSTVQIEKGDQLFTVVDSSTDGGAVTANQDCFISISLTDNFNTGSNLGFSLNSTELTTGIQGITAADRLVQERTGNANFDASATWSGFFSKGDVIRAHTSGVASGGTPSRTSMNILAWTSGSLSSQPTLYLKDEKTSGTDGGTFTSGSYVTRTLNTPSGDTSFLDDLTSNQFTLSSGIYRTRARAPGVQCVDHKIKLRDVDNSSDLIIGSSQRTLGGSTLSTDSTLMGEFTLTSSTTLELQHRCSTTRATDGLGRAISFGDVEVYAEIEIIKIS